MQPAARLKIAAIAACAALVLGCAPMAPPSPPPAVIAMHYNSNPIAPGTLAQFQAAMQGSAVRVLPMKEGERVSF